MEQPLVQNPVQTELTLHPVHECLQLFDEENIQIVILDPNLDTELVEIIRSQPEWSVDSEDDELVVFTIAKRN